MRKLIYTIALACLGHWLLPDICKAGIETNLKTINGPFSNGTAFTTKDKMYSNANWSNFISKSVQSTVALQVMDQVLISGAFTYSTTLSVQYYTSPGASPITVNPTLTVNYAPGQGVSYKGLDSYSIPVFAYQVIVTVTGSSSTGTVPANAVQLSTSIVIDRSYPFGAAAGIGVNYTIANNQKQLQMLWNKLLSADEYDVEWTTINSGNKYFDEISANAGHSSSPDDTTLSHAIARAFRNNGSRITTTDSTVSVSMISTDSLLLVRIRQVQYDPATGIRVAGYWDYTNGSGYAIWRLNWNENKQNWQYSAAFAEDGKKKEVMSYFDGTLRGRQTVTLNNTGNVSVAQENIYDDFGRSTASILPAPYKEPSLTPFIHYISNFNLNAASTPYTFANVAGTTTAACELNPDPLNTSAGAARYYSGNNDFKSLALANNYIPDASGYPISVTQYTNDNTARIKSQGGVGPAFQPGKSGSPSASKTTKYYYGKPEQWELDQLFANDAGYAEHYLKNMVVDPNGQISISYLNASRKTVATALTGKSPAMLDSLSSINGSTKLQNLHLLKPEQFIYNSSAMTLNANTTYLASVTGTDTLKFDIQKLINHYPGTFEICSNCYYKMTVNVTDDCGNSVASTSSPVKIGDTVSTCTDTATYHGMLLVPISQIGEYHVKIQFAFDNTAIQAFTNNFISSGLTNGYIEPQFDYIKKRYLDSINVSGCYSDCHTCETLLGTSADFVQMLKDKCIALGLDPAGVSGSSFTAWAGGLYTTLKAHCDSLQTGCGYAPCDAIRDVMLDDVSPDGQYALFDNTGTPVEPLINVISINWRSQFPVLSPSNPEYIINEVTKPDGTVTSANDASFSLADLVTYWKPDWASKFLLYHPEYCKYQFCVTNSVFESWDQVVQQDHNTAASVSTVPSTGSPLSYSYTNASDWLLAGDPFFQAGGSGHAYLSQMSDDLLHYSVNVLNIPITTQSDKGLMAFDDYTLYCLDGNINTDLPTSTPWDNCAPNVSCRVADREWTTYRQHYFDLKQKYYNLLRTATCSTSACPIGQPITSNLPGACPAITDFGIQLYTGTPSCGSGYQDVVIQYNPGTLVNGLTVQVYYPAAYDSPSLPHLVSFSAGDTQQIICVPGNIPVGDMHINAVYCGAVPAYGNDPSYVVNITGMTGATTTDFCGNVYSGNDVMTLTATLRDGSGNPVNAVNTVTVVIRYLFVSCEGDYSYPTLPIVIPAGQSSGQYVYIDEANCELDCFQPLAIDIDCLSLLVNASHVTGLTTCSGYTYSNPQPPSTVCAAYQAKTPRFPDYQVNTTGIPSDTTALKGGMAAAIKAQAADLCAGNAVAWINRLQPGLDAIGATSTQITNLTNAFISICAAGGDVSHPMGASSLPPGVSGTYADFGAAIKSIILGGGSFTPLLNPWLIDNPAPYTVPQQSVAKTISNCSGDLCTVLAALQAQAVTAGQTLYNYLMSTYGSAMTLSSSDVDVLVNSCSNCKFILAHDVTLPVFLEPGAKGCISWSEYSTAKTALLAQFSIPVDTAANYPTILSNYMNLKWGLSLTYDDYKAFETAGTGSLCNIAPYTAANTDPYDCVKNAVSAAVNSGLADYTAYINTQRQNFVSSYINTCKLAKANANLSALQQVYHYTLYHYDQADNLVRTVPPEGVQLVDAGLFGYIDKARDLDTAAYSYTYSGPTSNSSLSTALTTLSATLSASTGAIEMWLYNNGSNHYHWVEVTPDRKYLYQVNVAGTRLNIDVYPIQEVTISGHPSAQMLPATGHYSADISSLLPLYPFTHLVMQGNNLGAGTDVPQLYLNGTALTVNTHGTPAPVGFSIIAGTSSISYPDSIQHLKHLRLYNHTLSTATIMADAGSQFFNAGDTGYAGWYRFNTPSVGAAPTTINSSTSDETAIYDMYPAHRLLTSYAYNSTNQVTRQQSPDGGVNRYWYDMLSRLTVSQNDKQLPNNNYSYTRYDDLGRITEVGQKNQTSVSIGTPDYLTDAAIASFNSAGANSQITRTVYDARPAAGQNVLATLNQQNLRKRVAASLYFDTATGDVNSGLYYNYDLDGNVKTLYRQIPDLGTKQIGYEYDLVSGKVNFVKYQQGRPDAFYYKYNYDADNRLTEAWSGTTAMIDTATHSALLPANGKLDAKYSYYLHGPLERMEMGDTSHKVQGIDYAYTLQGWLKGVNSSYGTASADIGQDGVNSSHPVARDTYGYALGYYTDDYTPIGGSSYNAFALKYTANTGDITGQSLYNGNISNSILALAPFNSGAPVGYTYHYDQLNRLKKTRQHTGISGTSWDMYSITPNYQENATYDGNGNILTYGRNGAAPTAQTIDSLSYNYTRDTYGRLTNNKLNNIHDAVANSNYSLDLTNQTDPTNYHYDAIGNLIYDAQSNITGIDWSVYGKIQNIYKPTGNISYSYDPAGNRVSKTANGITNYYVRDAQGNPLAIYDNAHGNLNWKEQHLYGSSRLGMWEPNVNLADVNARLVWDTTGRKQYELENHLGNVLATISDKRLQVADGSGGVAYNTADISTAQDYYPFGMLQPGRQYNTANYRYGFNGKENDNDVKGTGNQQDYGMRIYDPRVGRFLSVDPLSPQYPELTPYQFASNSPIQNIDLDGLEGVNAFAEGAKRGEDPMAAMRTAGKTTFKFIGGLVYGALAIVAAPFNGISEAHYANNSKTPEQRAYHNKEASKYFKETAFNLITAEIGGELFGKMGKAFTVFSEVELNLAGKTTLSVLENDASRAASFKGGKFAISIAKEDITVYRVSGGTSGAGNGEFFSLTKPNNVADAEKMLNINMHGNTGEYVTPVVIKKGSQFAVGGVEGGSGTQLFIPKEVQNTGGNNIERLLDKTKSLPK